MTTAAQKQKAYRQRKGAGRVVLPVEVEFYAIADALTDAGILREWDADDRAAVAKAVSRLLEVVVEPARDS